MGIGVYTKDLKLILGNIDKMHMSTLLNLLTLINKLRDIVVNMLQV